ncbi:hypothetical protein ACOME3_010079 [Neoechinorhynchus agilis]
MCIAMATMTHPSFVVGYFDREMEDEAVTPSKATIIQIANSVVNMVECSMNSIKDTNESSNFSNPMIPPMTDIILQKLLYLGFFYKFTVLIDWRMKEVVLPDEDTDKFPDYNKRECACDFRIDRFTDWSIVIDVNHDNMDCRVCICAFMI